jgi:hypothetical protein
MHVVVKIAELSDVVDVPPRLHVSGIEE